MPLWRTVIWGTFPKWRHISIIWSAMSFTAAHLTRAGKSGLVTRCSKKRKGPVESYTITPATNSWPSATMRVSRLGQGRNPSCRLRTSSWYLPSHCSVPHTSFMWKCRACHLKRYLGLGDAGWTRLLQRAGMADIPLTSFSRARAKTLMKYHFVLLAEKKPTKWKRNSRYQGTRGNQKVRVPTRRVHPRLALAQ